MSNSSSALPMPHSLSRRSNGKRLSTFGSTRPTITARTNLVDSMTSVSVPSSIGRKSIYSTPASNVRRQSSIYSSQPSQQFSDSQGSDVPYSQRSVFNNTTNGTSFPRPVRDKQYQLLIQNEIYDFLNTNKFEVEMNHPLSNTTLTRPTQKDFNAIFQFLYNKIDPSYKFPRGVEGEVLSILKALNYPYLDGINRSQISTVGGSHWPIFMSMLYWLVKLNLQLTEVDELSLEKSLDDELSEIYDKYIEEGYMHYLKHNTYDQLNLYEEFRANFDQFGKRIQGELSKQEEQISQLKDEYDALNNEKAKYDNGLKKSQALENDYIKFQAYIEVVIAKKSDWAKVLDDIQQEIEKCKEESRRLKGNIEDFELSLRSKGLDVEKINRLNEERDELSKNIDNTNLKIDGLENEYKSNLSTLDDHVAKLEHLLTQYNRFVHKMHSTDYNFEIKLNKVIYELTRGEEGKGLQSSEILDKNTKVEKTKLIGFKSRLQEQVNNIEDSQLKLEEQVDVLKERISEQNEELENINSNYTTNKRLYEDQHNIDQDKDVALSTDIEKLKREINAVPSAVLAAYATMVNELHTAKMKEDELNHVIDTESNDLNRKMLKIVDTVLTFKDNVVLNLESLRDLVLNELEEDPTK